MSMDPAVRVGGAEYARAVITKIVRQLHQGQNSQLDIASYSKRELDIAPHKHQ